MSNQLFRPAALLVAAALSLVPAAPAQDRPQGQPQDKPQGEFGEKLNVHEVLLDVLVTDARGHVIVGLGKDDFVVREDGKPASNGLSKLGLPDDWSAPAFCVCFEVQLLCEAVASFNLF